MSRCNVDFFDVHFNYVHHDSIETPDIDDDYLAPEASSILVGETDLIPEQGLILVRDNFTYLGVVENVQDEHYQTRVSFRSFLTLFDQPVLFQTSLQNDASAISLEAEIKYLLEIYWKTSSDALQNIPINVTTTSTTTDWNLGILPNEDEGSWAIVNFYADILKTALLGYKIAVTIEPDLQNMVVNMYVGAPSQTFTIDADLPTIKINSFTINKMTSATNKLEIWNAANYTQNKYFYLHPDGTYDTTDSDRIEPVKLDVRAVTPADDQTFDQAAQEEADNTFRDISWTNYIELDVDRNDMIVDPASLRIGQIVNVLHNGSSYSTILTGKKLSYSYVLIFGTMRIDLTKKNKL